MKKVKFGPVKSVKIPTKMAVKVKTTSVPKFGKKKAATAKKKALSTKWGNLNY